jgi:hypothetical protein
LSCILAIVISLTSPGINVNIVGLIIWYNGDVVGRYEFLITFDGSDTISESDRLLLQQIILMKILHIARADILNCYNVAYLVHIRKK